MTEELPGIFNWMVEGLRRLITRDGFTDSKELMISSQEYRQSNDSVAMFIGNMCKPDESSSGSPIHTLYKVYNVWSEFEGLRPLSKRNFTDRMEDLGYKKKKGYVDGKAGQTFFEGLNLDREAEDWVENRLDYTLALQNL